MDGLGATNSSNHRFCINYYHELLKARLAVAEAEDGRGMQKCLDLIKSQLLHGGGDRVCVAKHLYLAIKPSADRRIRP